MLFSPEASTWPTGCQASDHTSLSWAPWSNACVRNHRCVPWKSLLTHVGMHNHNWKGTSLAVLCNKFAKVTAFASTYGNFTASMQCKVAVLHLWFAVRD